MLADEKSRVQSKSMVNLKTSNVAGEPKHEPHIPSEAAANFDAVIVIDSEPGRDNSSTAPHIKRRWLIAAIVSFGGFNSNLSSQLVSPAIPEVAAAFHTTGAILNINNALYMIFMAIGTLFWGPLSETYGRRWVGIVSSFLFLGCSLGSGLSPNLAAFFAFRSLAALFGIAFQVIGPACIADIYEPTERARVLGWFLLGTLVAPSIGPFLGGVMVAYLPWTSLFWFQSGLAGLACVLSVVWLQETGHHQKVKELAGSTKTAQLRATIRWANPFPALACFRYPKIIIISLLTPIRYVINPRFNLTSPLLSGIFFLVPGAGFIAGTLVGGPWSDKTVRVWTEKRGKRVPEDRLRSSFIAMGIGMPASILIYGWGIYFEKGGIALPVVSMFVQGAAQLICLPCLNAYTLEVVEGKSSEIMSVGTAVCIPMIDTVGVGWMSTVSALFIALCALGMISVVYFRVGPQP